MTPVTDPNLLAQLEGGQNLKPVSDPNLLAQLEGGAPQQAPQPQQSFADRFLPTPQPWAQNFDQGLQNAFMVPNTQGSGLAYTLGDITGNTAQFLAGGEALDAVRGAAEAIPYAGKLAEMLGGDGMSGVTRRALGSAAFGAVKNPDDITKGAGESAALSVAFDAIPGIGGGIAKGVNALRPQKQAEQILNNLSGGKKLEESAKSLAADISNAYEAKTKEGKELFNPIFDAAGKSSIYQHLSPTFESGYESLFRSDIPKQAAVNKISPTVFEKDSDVKDFYKKFVDDPTLENSHKLQSALGASVRDLKRKEAMGTIELDEKNALSGFSKAREAVLTDMNSFLDKASPELKNQYKQAQTNWAQNIAPYLENRQIAKIANEKITNPRNLVTIFKNPEEGTAKVVSDLGADGVNKILYAHLGKYKDSEKLAKAIGDLDKNGLGSYVTPQFEKQADALTNKINARKGAGMLASAIGGGLAGHSIGIPYGETMGAAAGFALSPLINGLVKKIPTGSATTQQIADALKAGYRPLSKAVIANAVNGDKQHNGY